MLKCQPDIVSLSVFLVMINLRMHVRLHSVCATVLCCSVSLILFVVVFRGLFNLCMYVRLYSVCATVLC